MSFPWRSAGSNIFPSAEPSTWAVALQPCHSVTGLLRAAPRRKADSWSSGPASPTVSIVRLGLPASSIYAPLLTRAFPFDEPFHRDERSTSSRSSWLLGSMTQVLIRCPHETLVQATSRSGRKEPHLVQNAVGAFRSLWSVWQASGVHPSASPASFSMSAAEQGLCGSSDDGSSLKQTQGGAEDRF